MTSFEFHVPISPTGNFFNRVHYLAASLQEFGGRCRDSRIVVTIGEDCEPFRVEDREVWSKHYNIEWRWIPRSMYQKLIYYGTALDRFNAEFQADVVVMIDADIVFSGDVSNVLDLVKNPDPWVAGVIAYYSPFENPFGQHRKFRDDEGWELVFRSANLEYSAFEHQYNGWNLSPERRKAPPYYNFGAMFYSRDAAERMRASIFDDLERVGTALESELRCQVAQTLSILRQGIRHQGLPCRYNFLTIPELDQFRPQEADAAVILHYLWPQFFAKNSDMNTPAHVACWLARIANLQGSNEALRRVLETIHPRVLRESACGLAAALDSVAKSEDWRNKYEQIVASRSWRVTKPLRETKRLVKRLLQ